MSLLVVSPVLRCACSGTQHMADLLVVLVLVSVVVNTLTAYHSAV